MLSTQSISYQYLPNLPHSVAVKPLTFPDINCARGETLCILGRSGCGKTTLLHLLGGLLRPATGTIHIDGQDINQLSEGQLDRFRGANIGVIFQQSHLIKSLTVAQNLLTAQYLPNMKQDLQKIAGLLDKLNLGHKLHSPANQLSVGEQQRVAIARALINSPALILADEPTSSLDDQNCEEVINLLQQQAAAHNSALVVVTHDARLKSQISQQLVLAPLV